MGDWPFPLPEFEPGWVWLAGAGPGDPSLLTVAAWHALRSADVILYDALIDHRILGLAREGAEAVYAGKRGGRPSCKQADITVSMIEFAKQGRRVLRLKGGDPFVFGRGAEEALALVAAGVPFRVIPGVSAGVGGLGSAGIPLTHRAANSAVTFLTGHNLIGAVPDRIDWTAIARGSPVIVVFMPLKHLAEIAGLLMGGGRAADEPAAIVSKASTEDQRVLDTTLGTCAEDVAASGIESPAILVVGEVVRLRADLDWVAALAARRLEVV